jgi:hypothetical protein
MVVLNQWCRFLLEGRGLIQKFAPDRGSASNTAVKMSEPARQFPPLSRPRRAVRVSLPPGNQSGRDQVRWAGRKISNRRRAMSLPPPRRRIDSGKAPETPVPTGKRAKGTPFLR